MRCCPGPQNHHSCLNPTYRDIIVHINVCDRVAMEKTMGNMIHTLEAAGATIKERNDFRSSVRAPRRRLARRIPHVCVPRALTAEQ